MRCEHIAFKAFGVLHQCPTFTCACSLGLNEVLVDLVHRRPHLTVIVVLIWTLWVIGDAIILPTLPNFLFELVQVPPRNAPP